MKRLVFATILVALAFGAGSTEAGLGGNCSPEGTWYGYNTVGEIWIVTITRSGPKSFTTVMDGGVTPFAPIVEASSDWRGEFVKTGPGQFDWTTMAYLRAVESFPFPYALGFCPLTAEFSDCDTWQGAGTCSFYGFFEVGQDPFEEGIDLGPFDPLQAFFKRMPMTYPIP